MASVKIKLGAPLEVKPAAGEIAAVVVDELVLDLDKLTGADVEYCAREAITANAGVQPMTLMLDPAFQSQIAARASGYPVETLRRLSALDYLSMVTQVAGFFLGAG